MSIGETSNFVTFVILTIVLGLALADLKWVTSLAVGKDAASPSPGNPAWIKAIVAVAFGICLLLAIHYSPLIASGDETATGSKKPEGTSNPHIEINVAPAPVTVNNQITSAPLPANPGPPATNKDHSAQKLPAAPTPTGNGQTPMQTEVAGTVLDEESNRPLQNVTVWVAGDSGKSVQTNRQGIFSLKVLAPKGTSKTLYAQLAGYDLASKGITIPETDNTIFLQHASK